MSRSSHPDPFAELRAERGVYDIDDQNDPVKMVLRLKDVRKCAHNWKQYSSEATPGRIVVPSEVDIRNTRQIPFELDPPLHGDFRALLDPWFKRPSQAHYQQRLRHIIVAQLESVQLKSTFDCIRDFSLPLQSRALTVLMNVPADEAETFISWGTHVFRSENDPLDAGKAEQLYAYIDQKIDEKIAQPGDDLFSLLLNAKVAGKQISKEEIKGIIILTFAGGRDTVINMVTNTLAYLAEHPESLERLRAEPEIRGRAIEELIRYFSPLTHMGRVAREDAQVCEHAVAQDSRISLCWASANRDASVFEHPDEVILDRKLNPHVAFGFAHHNCLGATHARTLMQLLLDVVCERVQRIDFIDAQENIEEWGELRRKVGYHNLQLSLQVNS